MDAIRSSSPKNRSGTPVIAACALGISAAVRAPLLILDADLQVVGANDALSELFQFEKPLRGRSHFRELFPGRWEPIDIASLLERAVVNPELIRDRYCEYAAAPDAALDLRIDARVVTVPGQPPLIVLTFENAPAPEIPAAPLQEDLLEVEGPFRLIADIMPQIVWIASSDGSHYYFNRRWHEYTGLSEQESLGFGFTRALDPRDSERTLSRWRSVCRGGDHYETEFRLVRADGVARWFVGRATPVKDPETNKTRMWVGTCTDIDDQKRAEQALLDAAAEMARVHEREHRIATQLQAALTPPIPDSVPGLSLKEFYRAGLAEANVGGDFCDVFRLDNAQFAMLLGDVAGKGLAAASQVSAVRNMVRYALFRARTLSGALVQLNVMLTVQELLTDFASIFVALYNAQNRTLTYVSCGHEPGLLRRGAAGEIEELPSCGPPLGVIETAQYRETVVSLQPGDSFLLYTDGLSEVGPTRATLLGTEGLADLMRAAPATTDATELIRFIVDRAESYSGTGFRDDVCLLAGIVR